MEPHLIQGSEEWLSIRRTKITSSDAAAIMGVSKWSTAYETWLSKLGFGKEVLDNPAMKRGRDLEPIARELFIKETGILVVPKVVFSKEYDFMMCSCDGLDLMQENLLEIKCPGQEDHQKALDGIIPEHYRPQILHQMLTTGLKKAFYFSFTPSSWKLIEMKLDEKEASELIQREKDFYTCMQTLEAPQFTDKDYITRSDDLWIERANLFKETVKKRKELELQEELIRQELIQLAGSSNARGAGISVSKIVKKGNIDYKSATKDIDIDWEKHRKPSTTYMRIS